MQHFTDFYLRCWRKENFVQSKKNLTIPLNPHVPESQKSCSKTNEYFARATSDSGFKKKLGGGMLHYLTFTKLYFTI